MKIKNQSLVIKRARTGLGLFTLKRIPANRRIIEYTGTLLKGEDREKARGRYLFEIDEKRVIDGRARSNTARYINHSCDPNSIGYIFGNKIWIWSLRAIEAGEELTLDYREDYVEQFIKPGNCKCAKCDPQPDNQ
jgi:uncharacterized protein